VFGARGFIPQATRNTLRRLLGPQPDCTTVREAQVTELLQRIMHIIFRAIIIIYKSWRRLATG